MIEWTFLLGPKRQGTMPALTFSVEVVIGAMLLLKHLLQPVDLGLNLPNIRPQLGLLLLDFQLALYLHSVAGVFSVVQDGARTCRRWRGCCGSGPRWNFLKKRHERRALESMRRTR